MADPTAVLGDLRDEGEELDRIVSALADGQWAEPTPAAGWTIAHQIAHLVWTDERALLSATDRAAFAEDAARALTSPETFVDDGTEEVVAEYGGDPTGLLARWRSARRALSDALAEQPPDARLPWYGPPMSVASMATGRLMETWAHGQDIADALQVRREPTARLRHVVRIGVRARDYAFGARGLVPPDGEFRVELTAPDGEATWTYGPEDAGQRVTGPALDFCLLVTQRAHRSGLALHAEGDDADLWLDIAQAFAGPPGKGRLPATPPSGPPGEARDVPGPPAPEPPPGTVLPDTVPPRSLGSTA